LVLFAAKTKLVASNTRYDREAQSQCRAHGYTAVTSIKNSKCIPLVKCFLHRHGCWKKKPAKSALELFSTDTFQNSAMSTDVAPSSSTPVLLTVTGAHSWFSDNKATAAMGKSR
jgi:hypothetical protein